MDQSNTIRSRILILFLGAILNACRMNFVSFQLSSMEEARSVRDTAVANIIRVYTSVCILIESNYE